MTEHRIEATKQLLAIADSVAAADGRDQIVPVGVDPLVKPNAKIIRAQSALWLFQKEFVAIEKSLGRQNSSRFTKKTWLKVKDEFARPPPARNDGYPIRFAIPPPTHQK